jgi:hypothetical protein
MNRDEELFAAALELPASERGEFVQRECGAHAALPTRVAALLKSHEAAEAHFMATAAT